MKGDCSSQFQVRTLREWLTFLWACISVHCNHFRTLRKNISIHVSVDINKAELLPLVLSLSCSHNKYTPAVGLASYL